MRRHYRALATIGVLVVLAALILTFQSIRLGGFERGGDTPLGLKLGLDLQGGIHLVYQAKVEDSATSEITVPTSDQMESLKASIERRVNRSGLGEPIILILGEDRLLVQLPGVDDITRAKSIIGETARLEFKHRTFDVPEDIEGLTEDSIVRVSIEERGPTAATSTPAAGEAADVATSTAEVADAATSTPDNADATPDPTPVFVVQLTAEAADSLESTAIELDESLVPVSGTNEIFPSFLVVSHQGETLQAYEITSQPAVSIGPGQVFPIEGEPNIERIKGTDSFRIVIPPFMWPPALPPPLPFTEMQPRQLTLSQDFGQGWTRIL